MTSTTVPFAQTARGRVESAMSEPCAELYKLLGKPVTILMLGKPNRRIEGSIESFDEYMNILVTDAAEVIVDLSHSPPEVQHRNQLGRILLKGDCVGMVSCRVPVDE